jgi:hypothetical protein
MPPSSIKIAGRQTRNDAGENDHRDTVTDTTFRDLLTKPHQEYRACNQRDARRDQERGTRIDNKANLVLQPACRRDRLEARQSHRAIACVLHDLAAALLTFLAQLLQLRNDVAGHLHDDR